MNHGSRVVSCPAFEHPHCRVAMHPRIERIYKTWTRFGNLQHTLECARNVELRRACPLAGGAEARSQGKAMGERAAGFALDYMLLRYSPPTSNSALVICPSEHTRTVFISSAKTLPSSITVRLSFSSAFGAVFALRA
jgi:hypothetical protein